MITMDVFRQDAFSAISLTAAVSEIPFIPSYLGSLNIFRPVPVNTVTVMVESEGATLQLVKTSERGAPGVQRTRDFRKARNFNTVRVRHSDFVRAHEIQGVRAYGSETELQTVQAVLAARQQGVRQNIELTMEYHRLGALQGILLDSDGSTLYNFFTEFGVSQPGEITFSNAAITAAGGMRAFLAQNFVRPMLRAAKIGQASAAAGIMPVFLCGDSFFDFVTEHADVKATYLNWLAAAELRGKVAFGEFEFGGCKFINYRGTDDNSTVAIASGKAKLFLQGVPGLFEVAYSPGESFDLVNTMGRSLYSRLILDDKRNEHVEAEMDTYPLHYCTRPQTLFRATL